MSVDVRNISVQPVITAGAYTANDNIGGLIKFKGSEFFNTGYIHALHVFDDGAQDAALDLILFNDNPSQSTITDNAAIVIHADDIGKIIGIISIATTDWITLSGASVAFAGAKSIPFNAEKSALFACLTTAGTPTYAATTDLTLNLGIFRDS